MSNLNYRGNINIQGSKSLFGNMQGPGNSLLSLQKALTEPDVPELATGTSLLNPSESTRSRLAHFDPNLYDLRPNSHLNRFLHALLGDAGTGQLRKRILMTRLWSILYTTHFYDLDRFYGAIFNVSRHPDELLPINPMVDLATPDGWDEISTFDARYRERLMKLANAIPLGGTPSGMQLMAEALTGVECEVYEIWSLVESAGALGFGRTYQQVANTYVNYAGLQGNSWGEIEARPIFGQMGNDIRNEFIIRPKKNYPENAQGRRDRAYDVNGVRRVIEKLKPAGTIVSIDDKGVQLRSPAPISNIFADSEFWDVVPRVIPNSEKETLYETTKRAYDARDNPSGQQQSKPAQGKTPFYEFLGQAWSAVPDIHRAEGWWNLISSVTTWRELGALETFGRQNRLANNNNYDTQVFPDRRVNYAPNKSYIDPKTAIAGSIAGDGVLQAAPYSAPRTSIGSRDLE